MDIRKGVINLVNDSKKMQTAQIEGLSGELADDVEIYQNYGFSSHPLAPDDDGKGCEVVLASLGSSDLTSVVASTDRRYRPKNTEPGDTVVYTHKNNDTPHRIELKTVSGNPVVSIKCGSTTLELLHDGTVTISGATINITADVNITGTLTNNGVNLTTHKHGGVQSGGSQTSTPI